MKILILVLSHNDGGIYTDFFNTQKETWDSIDEDGVKTYYYFGDSVSNHIDTNLIHLNISSDLKNCGTRTIEAFKMILDLDFDYLFRTNSSSYVDKKQLKEFLVDKPKSDFYCGIIGKHNSQKFCSGSGFFLSKDLVEELVTNHNEINFSFMDDVAFGVFFSSKDINLVQSYRYDVIDNSKIPSDYFHYRLKTKDRYNDINNMKLIFSKKCN